MSAGSRREFEAICGRCGEEVTLVNPTPSQLENPMHRECRREEEAEEDRYGLSRSDA